MFRTRPIPSAPPTASAVTDYSTPARPVRPMTTHLMQSIAKPARLRGVCVDGHLVLGWLTTGALVVAGAGACVMAHHAGMSWVTGAAIHVPIVSFARVMLRITAGF